MRRRYDGKTPNHTLLSLRTSVFIPVKIESISNGWNDTNVVLISKVKDPQCLKDLRPISLCNVLYKLISKVITARLKGILDEIISPNQSAFVPG